MDRVSVELLWSPGCPHAGALRREVLRASEAEGVLIDLVEREVRTPEEASRLRMPGSPTVRIGGRDVEPEAELRCDFGLG